MPKGRVKDVEQPKEEPKKEEKEKPRHVEKTPDVRNLVRIANTDINADKTLLHGIRSIKGVSYSMAKAICATSGFDPTMKINSLTETDITKLEEILGDPAKYGVPNYFLNRRREPETGRDAHLIGSDLDVAHRFDVKKYVDLKTYRGVRHMLGQPVRGQRTRSTFRQKGRVVGVMKKAIKLQAKAEEAKEEKK